MSQGRATVVSDGRGAPGTTYTGDILNSEAPSSINVERALRVLRRRGPIVLLCVLIAGGSAFAFAKHQHKRYTASASLLFTDNQLGAVASGLNPVAQPLNQSQQDTNVQLVQIGDVAAKTAAQLGPGWTARKVHGAITASPNSDTNIVSLEASASSPKLAQRIANTYASIFVNEQAAVNVARIQSAERLVNEEYQVLTPAQRASTQGLELANRAQALGVLAKLQDGNVSVASAASAPTAPSSPKVKRDTALGALLGLLIGVVIAFLLERLDRRVREPKDLEAAYDLPILAAVPERSDYEVLRSLGHAQHSNIPSVYDEVFNLLRSYLRYFSVDRDLRTLLVVSAGPGEGKTTVSYNLAKAAAALGSRVLLIEADLRRGTVIAPLLDRSERALSDVLIGDAQLEEAVRSIQVGQKGVLDVLIAGELPPPNVGELIESRAMEAVLERASAAYDLVVIDTPPLTLVADAMPLLTKVDGVIVVGRVGKSRRDAAEQLRKKLESLRAPVLGIVANGVTGPETAGYRRRLRYGYAYGYGYSNRAVRELEFSSNGSSNGSSHAAGAPTDVS
jgi:capsular exopolysaccharide synthesis family protein